MNLDKKLFGIPVLYLIFGALILGLMFLGAQGPGIVGLFVADENTASLTINQTFNVSDEMGIELDYAPTSVRLTGSLTIWSNGSAKVYLETEDAVYLILDEAYVEEKGISSITAFAAKDVSKGKGKKNKTEIIDDGEDEIGNVTNETIALNETIEINETVTNLTETNETEEIIDLNETILLNESLINETIEIFNETNETVESNETISLNATITNFTAICRETCALTNVTQNFTLKIELVNASIYIEDLGYTYARPEVNNVPQYTAIQNITMDKNTNLIINLSQYFTDLDGDPLLFSATDSENLTVYLVDAEAKLVPKTNFTGEADVSFAAFDGINSTLTDPVRVIVADRALNKSIATVQILAEIGKPVRWVKNVKVNQSIVNLTVNISAIATNISVREVIGDQEFDIAPESVMIKINDTITPLEQVPSNTPVGGVTGNVIAVPESRGWLTRTLGLAGITGRAIQDVPQEFMNTSVNVTFENEAEVIIEENVTQVIVEYYTEGPQAIEENITDTQMRLTVTSDIPYQNILTYRDIREAPPELIRVLWYVNESEYRFYEGLSLIDDYNNSLNMSSEQNVTLDITSRPEFLVTFYDNNNNSLIDQVSWITPHLSNQTFDINLSVLDVQSYPVIGGNWTTRFLTLGTANLSITGYNQTTFTEMATDTLETEDDLKALRIECGNVTLFNSAQSIFNESVHLILPDNSTIPYAQAINTSTVMQGIRLVNYSCAYTGYHTVQVLTPGVHNQLFTFGNVSAFANNLAQYAPVPDIIRFADGNLTNTVFFLR